jgi:hypothetical protein
MPKAVHDQFAKIELSLPTAGDLNVHGTHSCMLMAAAMCMVHSLMVGMVASCTHPLIKTAQQAVDRL